MEKSPVPVMVQVLLERALSAEKLNRLFERATDAQYTRSLLLSSIFELMNLVVFKTFPSVNAAYKEKGEQIGVSITSVYNKLNGLESNTSATLVRETAAEKAQIIEALGGTRESWLEGYRIKVIDGNCIEATEHRLEVLRETKAGALPGKSLVVYDPALEMATDVFPCEDGHAQERSLLEQVLPTVNKREVWITDRNFCVRRFLLGIAQRGGYVICREHQGLFWEELTLPRYAGQTDSGKLYEQWIKIIDDEGKTQKYRRITIKLKTATRDGENELLILTNLPKSVA
ncbi:MAG: IS4/IS5 family transposase, partial [Gammaproteobacteria bacterium]|nr:IS4/IS5 family transposase [Gammaproteobacteria bacterium]